MSEFTACVPSSSVLAPVVFLNLAPESDIACRGDGTIVWPWGPAGATVASMAASPGRGVGRPGELVGEDLQRIDAASGERGYLGQVRAEGADTGVAEHHSHAAHRLVTH
jgi:hypothetical protein